MYTGRLDGPTRGVYGIAFMANKRRSIVDPYMCEFVRRKAICMIRLAADGISLRRLSVPPRLYPDDAIYCSANPVDIPLCYISETAPDKCGSQIAFRSYPGPIILVHIKSAFIFPMAPVSRSIQMQRMHAAIL